jgi:hypothetical protein
VNRYKSKYKSKAIMYKYLWSSSYDSFRVACVLACAASPCFGTMCVLQCYLKRDMSKVGKQAWVQHITTHKPHCFMETVPVSKTLSSHVEDCPHCQLYSPVTYKFNVQQHPCLVPSLQLMEPITAEERGLCAGHDR